MGSGFTRAAQYGAVLGVVAVAAACGGSSTPSSSSGGGGTVPSGLSVSSLDSSFSQMASLKPVTAAGHGLVGVILPDTTSSTRYVNFDLPYLTKAFQMAGYASPDFKIANAQAG